MTRKDFEIVAQAMADMRPSGDAFSTWLDALIRMSNAFAAIYPRFDKARFQKAACNNAPNAL